ncbi:HpcH/HpaI aldolase/citrate lyase family protein [Neobacillus sp. MM2021_6]|uniref:HpcH/HpaI aldolase/citrate lyase family protein n=1 Tax=Bacillaceae TaxID=186817 RepID=UPI00140B57FA|nr:MULTISPECIES: HpcH/HpaI aldolase/citrate lyase family protein [Bacillaceae]MBO0958252.1 HpcH/HpaI aldolase/citrate lyase family protein [Neobacillus sp. MM2021_6]NHC17852.1 HpcH/HpaI aldolase/citrate lyase family protein [Bacillus sp. MM2020_4]
MEFFTYLYEDEIEQFFYRRPQVFNKYSDRELLSYGLGATLYMPATRPNIHQEILSKKHEGLTSLVIDLEDAVGDNEVIKAEELLTREMLQLKLELNKGFLTFGDLPLMFIRIRSLEQLIRVTERLGQATNLLTGVVLPKFSAENGKELLETVRRIHTDEHPFYAMPILETAGVIQKETRIEELMRSKHLLDQYKEHILNVRIGATDFCGLYGIRRSADTTVYEIAVLRDCISDIINVFQRYDSPYVVSGPVWEYFSTKNRMLKPQLRQTPFRERYGADGLKWRAKLIDENMDGFIREILMDIANGITGKTIIHPSHIKIVQALNIVSYEEYIDASTIVQAATGEIGVMKSMFANKMNEIKPHYYWAKKILLKSQLYGVLHEDYTNIDLIKKEVYV